MQALCCAEEGVRDFSVSTFVSQRKFVTNNTRDLRAGELHFPDLQILTPTQFLKTLP